jgi:two-component system, cell cycle response regulator
MGIEIQDKPAAVDGTVEVLAETWLAAPQRPVSSASHDACLVQIYPTGPGMGSRLILSGLSLIFGRDKDCDIQLDDHAVSRHHARIELGADGHYVVDLHSTNGTFVNDKPATLTKLEDGHYLRIGNCIYRYLAGGNVEAEYHEEIYRLTIIDGLTGIHNKRYLLEFLDRELARSARHKRPLALLLFDLDRFKAVNDRLGHLGGDYTLRELVARLKTTIRKEELFSRYGGEEFVIVLPETNLERAIEVGGRLRQMVEVNPFIYDEQAFHVTISLGVVATQGDETLTPTQLIRQADHNLYLAKSAGRNRLIA